MSEDAKRPNGTFINNLEHLHALTETHIKQTELIFSPLSWRYIDQAEKVPVFHLIA